MLTSTEYKNRLRQCGYIEIEKQKYNDKYHNDDEFREKEKQRRRERYARQKVEKTLLQQDIVVN